MRRALRPRHCARSAPTSPLACLPGRGAGAPWSPHGASVATSFASCPTASRGPLAQRRAPFGEDTSASPATGASGPPSGGAWRALVPSSAARWTPRRPHCTRSSARILHCSCVWVWHAVEPALRPRAGRRGALEVRQSLGLGAVSLSNAAYMQFGTCSFGLIDRL